MKKLYLCAALSAMILTAQDAKVAPKDTPKEAPKSERNMTETESLKIQLAAAKIQLLREQFKIEDFNKQVEPLSSEQYAVVAAACKSVGVPEDKIQTECGVSTGVGPDGKPQMGADGKPVQARVWWNKPAPAPDKK